MPNAPGGIDHPVTHPRTAAVIAVCAASALLAGADDRAPLRFAWPARAVADVELTDERSVGDERRVVVMVMRMTVEPDGATRRRIVRLSDVRLVSVDGSAPGETDPAPVLIAVGRVMKATTPTFVVSADGRFDGVRDLERLSGAVQAAAGFPTMFENIEAFRTVLSELAAEDWDAWVGAWRGERLAPGESFDDLREEIVGGATVPVRTRRRGLPPSVPDGRTRLEALTIFPSEAVKEYADGFLIDMAREARELGDDDPVASVRFLERAHYSPMVETRTVELETATMRPYLAERSRAFTATAGRHVVEGRERRTHRFTWLSDRDATAGTP